MKATITNLAMYKIGWIACVAGAASGKPWLGLLAVAFACAIHVATSHTKSKTFLLLLAAAVIGLTWESFMVFSGWLDYRAAGHTGITAPYWIVAMWVLFATTLNQGFSWLKDRPGVAALFGGIGGPLAFIAGQKLGAVELTDPVYSVIVVGIGWAFLMPLMVFLARYLNGHGPATQSTEREAERSVSHDPSQTRVTGN